MRRVNLLVHDRCITMRTGCSQFQRTSLDRVKITWSLSREKAGGRYGCIGLTRLMCCIKATTSAILWPELGRVVSRKALGGSFLAIVVSGKPSFPKGVTRTSQPTGRQRVDVVMARNEWKLIGREHVDVVFVSCIIRPARDKKVHPSPTSDGTSPSALRRRVSAVIPYDGGA